MRQVVTVVEDARAADEPAVTGEQHVAGAGLGVAAVEVGVGALLLDHEDVLAQASERVDLRAGQLVEREGDTHGACGAHDKNSNVRCQAVRASGIGMSGKTWIRSGASR